MRELRALSTRARITPTGFVNTYDWGDFKGDPRVLMERYFDAFLYLANWGTRLIMIRLPSSLLDLETAGRRPGQCLRDGDAGRRLPALLRPLARVGNRRIVF